jgi:hypothetical protein
LTSITHPFLSSRCFLGFAFKSYESKICIAINNLFVFRIKTKMQKKPVPASGHHTYSCILIDKTQKHA